MRIFWMGFDYWMKLIEGGRNQRFFLGGLIWLWLVLLWRSKDRVRACD